jgi:hypothetical protein
MRHDSIDAERNARRNGPHSDGAASSVSSTRRVRSRQPMQLPYGVALAAAYASALVAWWLLARRWPSWWSPVTTVRIERPWREILWTVLAIAGVIGIGQLYMRGFLFDASGARHALLESVNQLLIFSPMLALLWVRRLGWQSAWIRTDRVLLRCTIGLGLALLAIAVFTFGASGARPWIAVVPAVFRVENVPHAVQVLLEDVAIAMLVVRLGAALGRRTTLIAVAALFAAGHVPAMLVDGASAAELFGLIRDFLLGLGIIGVAWRSSDVWWLWPVHFAMDMLQFVSGTTPS